MQIVTDDLEEKPSLQAGIDINVRFPGLAAITTGLSQVLSNSIAAIASGIGRQLLPSHLIKLAKAEREIALIRAQTLVDIARIGSDAIVQVQELTQP